MQLISKQRVFENGFESSFTENAFTFFQMKYSQNLFWSFKVRHTAEWSKKIEGFKESQQYN